MSAVQHRVIGNTGVQLPPIVFGTSCLGNLYEVVADDVKAAICRNWFSAVPCPVALDSAGKYGAGMALEVMGRNLRALKIKPEQVVISNKLGWYQIPLRGTEPTFEPGAWAGLTHDAEQRISREGIAACWEQGCELLGGYVPQMVSVHDPDEYLAAAKSQPEREQRRGEILDAYEVLFQLKLVGQTKAVGIGSKDWRVIRDLARDISFDWVMLACSFTILEHPPELLEFIAELNQRGVFIINSAVFHAGFLTGGKFFDYRVLSPDNKDDAPLFVWREKFFALCQKHDVAPAAACVQFSMSAPGIFSVALNTGNPKRIAENAAMATTRLPDAFWRELKSAGLISAGYPYLGRTSEKHHDCPGGTKRE
ncbi:MAG: aldo/keto reductase [Verrucomicrobia bacterium]|nr:MAG: aldo/keto reductase [Verrucomicrobiota bacterium]